VSVERGFGRRRLAETRAFLIRTLRLICRKAGFEISRAGLGFDPFADAAAVLGRSTGLLILDVGANVGQTLDALRRHFVDSKFHCFEPSPRAFEVLAKKYADIPSIRLFNLALSDVDGKALFHETRSTDGSSLLPIRRPSQGAVPEWLSEEQAFDVAVRRLDQLLAREGVTTIDLLKLDVQGGELLVLNGCGEWLRPNKIRTIYVELTFEEFYESQPSFGDVYSFLHARGYDLVHLYEIHRRPSLTVSWCNGLFAAPMRS
jgi:FkbM family methyltransferase